MDKLNKMVSKAEQLKRKADIQVRKSNSLLSSVTDGAKTPPHPASNVPDTLLSSIMDGDKAPPHPASNAPAINEQTVQDTSNESQAGSILDPSISSIKKIELPDFSGNRKDWPEFKSIFKHLAEAAIPSEQALAFELKRHIKAPADSLIQSVFCTKKELMP